MTKKIGLLILISFLLTNCGVIEKMETERVELKANNFETSGFYYTKPEFFNTRSELYIFYKNGVFFGGFGVSNGIEGIKEFLLDSVRVNATKDLAYSWGVFQVNGDSVKLEKWISADAFAGYPTVKYTGKVLNKKSILIYTPKVYAMRRPPKEFTLDTLYYYPFKVLPSSSNKFIK